MGWSSYYEDINDRRDGDAHLAGAPPTPDTRTKPAPRRGTGRGRPPRRGLANILKRLFGMADVHELRRRVVDLEQTNAKLRDKYAIQDRTISGLRADLAAKARVIERLEDEKRQLVARTGPRPGRNPRSGRT